ncbi:MAG: glycosyltransferase [Deltaproteobacteria bacterium]|nr:glycosyltransferase [Deltaproteobacteria bacterium]
MFFILESLWLIGPLAWIAIFFLPWKPWSTREALDSLDIDSAFDLSDVTVLTPARDEAEVIAHTAEALNHQGKNLQWVLVDDQSSDGTGEIAQKSFQGDLKVVRGETLPEGWAGKLWALEQGRTQVKTKYILLLDADILLKPRIISTLKQKLESENLDFVSLMAHLRMQTFWEKLLVPSFIYFFKLLYPFSLANSPRSKMAAAAGGCIFLRAEVLEKIGGFNVLRNALIDDCGLAKKVKEKGFKTWLGLTHSVVSHRDYPNLKSIWDMVARSAFTQLQYSNLLLLGCTFIMTAMFLGPLFGSFLAETPWIRSINLFGFVAMIFTYKPTLLYYKRAPLWAFLMPFIGVLYLMMTWTSAIRFWRGQRSKWKGRIYHTHSKAA